jgi:hypothetical protein
LLFCVLWSFICDCDDIFVYIFDWFVGIFENNSFFFCWLPIILFFIDPFCEILWGVLDVWIRLFVFVLSACCFDLLVFAFNNIFAILLIFLELANGCLVFPLP